MSRCSDTSVNRLTEKTGPLKDAVMATWQLKKKKKSQLCGMCVPPCLLLLLNPIRTLP